MAVIDAHCHIFPPSFAGRRAELTARDATFAELFANPQARMADAPTLLAAMEQDGIGHAVVAGIGWTDPAIAREANDYLIQSVAANPRRLTGFCSVNPAWGETAAEEVERCADAGLRGIGELHPAPQRLDLADRARLAPVMDAARRRGMPLLLHCSEPVGHPYPGKGDTTPGPVYRLITDFPENDIICAHWGGGLPFYSLMPEVAAALERVYFDTAASPFLYRPAIYAAVAGLIGSHKILFATDYPLMRHRRALREAVNAALPPPDIEAILSHNAARLLRLPDSITNYELSITN